MNRALEPNISRPMPERAESLVPGDPIAAQDLPSASPETTELLGRWQKRRLRLNRIYWIGLGTLIFGYSALVEIYWNFRTRSPWINGNGDYVPAGLWIPLAIMVFVLAWILIGDRNDPDAGRKWRKVFSDDGEGISRHQTPAILIALWRILILFEASLLLSAADAATPHTLVCSNIAAALGRALVGNGVGVLKSDEGSACTDAARPAASTRVRQPGVPRPRRTDRTVVEGRQYCAIGGPGYRRRVPGIAGCG